MHIGVKVKKFEINPIFAKKVIKKKTDGGGGYFNTSLRGIGLR